MSAVTQRALDLGMAVVDRMITALEESDAWGSSRV
jgi:hypothetical protein